MGAWMAKAKGKGAAGKGGTLTTIKASRQFAAKLGQLAALTGVSIPAALDRYERVLDEDLLRELAKRKAEIEQSHQP